MSINLAEAGAAATITRSDLGAAPIHLQLLTSGDEKRTLAFLARRPLHTVSMVGLILENGLSSPLNRGAFYACRNAAGHIEGVALIGHATLIEAYSDSALEAFARLAQVNYRAHLIRGEQEMIERFLDYYSPAGYPPRLISREMLLELRRVLVPREHVNDLRPATLEDLEQVLSVNAAMIYDECGINPIEADPVGFRKRTARRIERGRIWVWIKDGQIIFKTDVMSATPEAMYLEGVYVNPVERGKGYGLRCLSQLCQGLLRETKSICLLVNEHNRAAINFYRQAGYTSRSRYDTIYLQRQGREANKSSGGM